MEEKEFNLSEKVIHHNIGYDAINIENVKEFIKRVESEVITGNPHSRQMLIKLKELAGDKLT